MKNCAGFPTKTTLFLFASLLSGCTSAHMEAPAKPSVKPVPVAAKDPSKQVYYYTAADRDCLKRAMYFESRRTSKSGFMAVGTVIMNRLTSSAYPDTICEVVAQEKQFAPGVMTRAMDLATAPELEAASDAILRGERHPDVKEAMFFHTDGLKFPYRNMSYVAVAGGNAFYEKRGREGELQTPEPMPVSQYVLSFAQEPTVEELMVEPQDLPTAATVVAFTEPTETDFAALPQIAPVPLRRPAGPAYGVGQQAFLVQQPVLRTTR